MKKVDELFEMFWDLYDCKTKTKFSRGDLRKFFRAGYESGLLQELRGNSDGTKSHSGAEQAAPSNEGEKPQQA